MVGNVRGLFCHTLNLTFSNLGGMFDPAINEAQTSFSGTKCSIAALDMEYQSCIALQSSEAHSTKERHPTQTWSYSRETTFPNTDDRGGYS